LSENRAGLEDKFGELRAPLKSFSSLSPNRSSVSQEKLFIFAVVDFLTRLIRNFRRKNEQEDEDENKGIDS
jgi:hypothetical protein